jgi:hypothetical protein
VLSTYTSVILTLTSHDHNLYTKSAILTTESNFHTQSVISTRTRVISTLKVQFPPQSVIYTHTSVILTGVSLNMTLTRIIYSRRVRFLHAQEGFLHAKCNFHPQSVILHAECDFHPYECNFDTCAYEYDSHEYNLYTKSAIPHAECDFYTPKRDFYTHKRDFYTQSAISTRRV